jgi:3-mercaptopyruvate sulfurtransferase SseA
MNSTRSTQNTRTHHKALFAAQLVEISVSHLATQLRSDPTLRVLDVSQQHRSLRGPTGLPQSVPIDWEAIFSAGPNTCPSPLVLASAMSQLGIGDEHTIVVHDEGSGVRARAVSSWLKQFGHSGTLVLRGGRTEWVAQGFKLVHQPASHKASSFTVRLNQEREEQTEQDLRRTYPAKRNEARQRAA